MSSEIAARIAGERKAIRALCEAAIEQGFSLSYFDGEEWAVKKSRNVSDIMKECHSTDEAAIGVSSDRGIIGTFYLVYGNAPDEVISDYGWKDECFKAAMDSLWHHAIASVAVKRISYGAANSGAAMR